MENNYLIEKSQIINFECQNPQSSQKIFRNEEDEIQQNNNLHFQNLSSSSIQVLSEQQSILGQENHDDDYNLIIQENNQKNSIENQQNQQQISFYLKGDDFVYNQSNIAQNLRVKKKEQIKDDRVVQNYSINNNYSQNKDIKQVSINPLIDQNPKQNSDLKFQQQSLKDNIQKSIQHIEKPKSIIKSPKSKSGTSNIKSRDHSQVKNSFQKEQILIQNKDEKQFNQMIESNLKEIFLFYTKQFQTPIKQNTKDQIIQQKQVLNLQQFLHFCKNFQLIDLLVTNQFIQRYAGHNNLKPLYKIKYKNRVGGSFVITKQILEEVFFKCSTIQQLSFQEFLYSLIKIADIAFPVSNSLKALYSYLDIHDPEIYSKKLIKIQDMNQSRMQDQTNINIKQELKVILPQIVNQPKTKNNYIQLMQNHSKIQSNRNKGYSVKFEDNNQDFDPRKLLLEEDLTDQEDELYLRDYMINQLGTTKKQEFIKQYQERQRIKYNQYPYENQQSKIKQGQKQQIYIQQNLLDLNQKQMLQQRKLSIQKILEIGDSQQINYNINQTQKLLQKQKIQFIHPNSFELRKNYNMVKQLQILNKSHLIRNISSSIEREQQNTSQNIQENNKNTQIQETNEKKRELQDLIGKVKNQYHSIRKIFRK
ncbi:unnamed protein product [Paramecium pentaurelia]|uniref:Uncharacterized protein n=1 Tax=Paramecium pentaurelia TaxID=43138 RepID=A0A8S1S4R6_9CILI|nr:unnamed protein product [Paramecium pentaurelia]